ncbi:MAG: serine/threonine protein kinase, partial [Acidobacteria bacterium]|nr:serine/threonine protein kinase [Acidobacteriota bacterium]
MRSQALRERFFAAAPRYEDRGFLGRGGAGIVFAAFDRELEQEVALKVLAPPADSEDDWSWRLRREVRSARRVKHPNVAQIYDLAEAGEFWYVTMELVPGRSLAEVLDEGPLTVSATIPILRQAALGAQAAHDLGIVHRDLKPGNIMVGAEGEVAVLDFGLAVDVRKDVRRTRHGLLPGTPAYMAPEQIREQQIDGRIDVYALGVIGWEALTGVSPFVRESPMKTLLAHLNETPFSRILDAVGVPSELVDVLVRCIAKEPASRPATAAVLARELSAFQVGAGR